MESFIDCISCCDPTPLQQLLAQSNDQKIQTLGSLTTIALKSFSNKSVWGMKRCWNCRDLHLIGLTESDLYSFICSLPTITEAWILQHGQDCALVSINFDSCVICQESYDALYHCFSNTCFAHLRSFTLKPVDNDKNSRLTEKSWRPICDRLKAGACPSLECINLSNNVIGSAGMEALMEVYESGHIIKCTVLDLSGNAISDKGAVALARLFDNPDLPLTLECLNLSRNRIHAKGFDTWLTHFGSMTHKDLQTLNLVDNSINAESVQNLCRILEMGRCPQLRCLDLSGTTMKTNAAIAFANAIRAGAFKFLEELRLNNCAFNTECIDHICSAVVDCPLQMLRRLELAHNRLAQPCVQSLCRMLQRKSLPSLKELDISSNRIGDDGIQEFNNKYQDDVMMQVEVLNLSDNGISNQGAFAVFDNVRHRQWRNLRDLNMERNKFSDTTAVQLRSLLEMDNDLDTIRLTDMTKRRVNVPLYRRETVMRSSEDREKDGAKVETKYGEMSGAEYVDFSTKVENEGELSPTA